MVYGIKVNGEESKHYITIEKDEVDDFKSGKRLSKILQSRFGTYEISLELSPRILVDRNCEEIPKGSNVLVLEPGKEDLWQHEFQGTVVDYRDNNTAIVMDQEENAWDVHVSKLERV